MDKEKLGARLRELREAAGLSRQELADNAGMKIGGLRDIEQGRRMPLFDTAAALAAALGVDCRAFLEEPADRPQPKPGRPSKTATEEAPSEPEAKTEPKKGKKK